MFEKKNFFLKCYECIHKPECDISHSLIPGEEKPYFECVVCGERADQQCIQCSDYFCSTTWMGIHIFLFFLLYLYH